MSHLALQRVMVRMLYDPDLVARVLDDPAAALADVPLEPAEIDFLRVPDPRAWEVDPERSVRSLNILVQQFPTASVLVARETGGADALRVFFRSPAFHACIQEGGSLAGTYGAELVRRAGAGEWRDPRIVPLAELETAIAALHRGIPAFPPPTGPGERYRLSPDKALHRAPAGTADVHEAIHRDLARARDHLARAVVDGRVRVGKHALRPADGEEPLLLELARDDGPRIRWSVAAAEITVGLYGILDFARVPRDGDALARELVRLGADEEEAPQVVAGLVDEGTLVPV